MADWFKVYNNMLDDPKFQYAIGEHSVVTSVTLLILSEASKARSAKIPWAGQDFEMAGYARKLNISIPILNECINLLLKIGFIEKDDKFLKVLTWNEMQSDYCRGKDRGYYKKTSNKLASVSLESTVRREERRGEEKKENGFSVLSAADKVIKSKELERCMKRMDTLKSQYSDHQDWDTKDRSEFNTLKTRRNVLRSELGVHI